MKEWVLKNIENTDLYLDDTIIGSTGDICGDVLINNQKYVLIVLETLKNTFSLLAPERQIIFEGSGIMRKNSTGGTKVARKLLSFKKWELHQTITELRGFLGLTNFLLML
jgi:hypothetical protein